MTTIELPVDYYGRKMIDGVSCFKIGTGSALLEHQGWRAKKRTRSYSYLLPPEGISLPRGKSPVVTMKVPTEESVRNLADLLHALGDEWHGIVAGWPAYYRLKHTKTVTMTPWSIEPNGLQREAPYQETHIMPSEFQIGDYDTLWYMGCRWDNGDEKPPRWHAYCDE